MKTTLKQLHDLFETTDNTLATTTISNHIKGLFLELTGNIDWDLDTPLDVNEDLYDNWDSDETYTQVDYDMSIIPDNDMDIAVNIRFNVDATQHMESDGFRFFENIGYDVFEIIFYVWGDEWVMTDDADAKKFVNEILNTWI